ncbi:hypothetical protein TNCV_3476541 [Trichonephila clavipes]|nr:hypothetical protein TNCV_3476541 [Trichonephila clavipes]
MGENTSVLFFIVTQNWANFSYTVECKEVSLKKTNERNAAEPDTYTSDTLFNKHMTATAGSDVVQSGRPIFDDFFQHLWPYIGNNTANVVFQMVKRLWLIRIDQ